MSGVNKLPLTVAGFVGIVSVMGALFVGSSMADMTALAPQKAVLETSSGASVQLASYKGDTFSPSEKRALKELIRTYLLEEPEVLLEAMEALENKNADATAEQAQTAILSNWDTLTKSPRSFVGGNPNGDVSIVEFFDYNCGYCKQAMDAVMEVVEADGNIRLVLKEFPILSESSTIASEMAVAALKQGNDKYLTFHKLLMENKGKLTDDKLTDLATESGLNLVQLQKDMKADDVQATIEESYNLARAIGVRGTPGFVIGEKLYPGAASVETLKKIVADARRSCTKC
ncbi:MAG: DsbA family protein [Parvibaculaceae bacterium]|nr:DsbA family protein [Parvibaculaceae bacterium]